MVTVCTLLAPPQRPRVDAAAQGWFLAFHCDTWRDALSAARGRSVDALIVAPEVCADGAVAGLVRFAGEFPAIAPIALVSRIAPDTGDRLLQLGANGVRWAVDCSVPAGWQRLRALIARPAPAPSAAARIAARLLPALGGPDTEAWALFDLLARLAPVLRSVARLARRLQLPRVALEARFRRAGLPAPKTYLAGMRLLHAAHLWLNPSLSLTAAVLALGYGWTGSLNRQVRASFGVTASEFRRRYPFPVLLERYVDRLIIPYREALLAFHPLHGAFGGARTPHRARFPVGGISPPRRARPGAPELSVLA